MQHPLRIPDVYIGTDRSIYPAYTITYEFLKTGMLLRFSCNPHFYHVVESIQPDQCSLIPLESASLKPLIGIRTYNGGTKDCGNIWVARQQFDLIGCFHISGNIYPDFVHNGIYYRHGRPPERHY